MPRRRRAWKRHGGGSKRPPAGDDGSGADFVLLAHLAERAGETAQAEVFFNEESWCELGPAMLYRLGNLYEATERPAEALEAYSRFLETWSGADPELPPVALARDAVERLRGEVP